jgi:hypothetical protein
MIVCIVAYIIVTLLIFLAIRIHLMSLGEHIVTAKNQVVLHIACASCIVSALLLIKYLL